MYKKVFLTFVLFLLISLFSFSICLANEQMLNDAANNVKDSINKSENSIENGAKDISDKAKNMTKDAENKMQNMENDMMNNNTYTSTRTATNIDEPNYMGMSATSWTWLIVGIVAIAIIALIWYYAIQSNNNYSDVD